MSSEARYCQLVRPMDQKMLKTLEQLSWCEKPIFVELLKVLIKLESNNSLISKLQPFGLLWMLLRHQMVPGGRWTVCLGITKAHECTRRQNTSEEQRKWDIFEPTVDSLWKLWLKHECTFTPTRVCVVQNVLSCSAPLSLQLYCTSSRALLAWELTVIEHLIWKYIWIVKEKIMFINVPQSNSGNEGFISWIFNHSSHLDNW